MISKVFSSLIDSVILCLTASFQKLEIHKLLVWWFYSTSWAIQQGWSTFQVLPLESPFARNHSGFLPFQTQLLSKQSSRPTPTGIVVFSTRIDYFVFLSFSNSYAADLPIPKTPDFILSYCNFIFYCFSTHSDMTTSMYINRSHALVSSLKINCNEAMPPEK